ncbi:MAG: preprotein translocase subunit SecA [Gammaproteobacteria bacterium]
MFDSIATRPFLTLLENGKRKRYEIPRPGIRLGSYPEKKHEGINQGVGRVFTPFNRLSKKINYGSKYKWYQFVNEVNRAEKELFSQANKGLASTILEVRQLLYRKGLTDRTLPLAFALIREVANLELGKRHYDEQLIGGWLLSKGQLAEMETGEGKTLTATLPACAAAMAGIPVHVITVNDYLAERDAKALLPLYKALGISVDSITAGADIPERKSAYACDITYCSNKQLVFDYLRDRVARPSNRPGLQALKSGESSDSSMMLRGLCFAIVDEADSVLIDEARTPLVLSKPGDNRLQTTLCRIALKLAARLDENLDYQLNPKTRQVHLTDRASLKLFEAGKRLGSPWNGKRRREEWVTQAVAALHLYVRDQDYLVRDNKVQIVDESTGRILEDRSWERSLHQMIECKEDCEITAQNETLARISYQQYFRRYLHLCGMSGTATEVASELWSVYQMPVVKVPTHRPSLMKVFPDTIFLTKNEKWPRVVEIIKKIHQKGRPILVGTRSVKSSEALSGMLAAAGLEHQVLNARQDKNEASVISHAGEAGQITVATNMAGRGTDIILSEEAEKAGGLHVIATERHASSRIDRQLFGRSARQGAPGSCQAVIALDDDLTVTYLSPASRLLTGNMPLAMRAMAVRYAQRSVQHRNRILRQELLKHNEYLRDFLAFSGTKE